MNPSTPLSIASADDAREYSDELSDSDLEQVVGGLARVWHAESPMILEPMPTLISVTSIVAVDERHRISA